MERLQHHPPEQQGDIVRQLNAPDANEQSRAAFEASGMQYNEWLENGGYQGYLKRQEGVSGDVPAEELPEVAPESETLVNEVTQKHTRTRSKEHMTRAQARHEITKATASSEKTDDVAIKNDWKIEKEFTYGGVDNKSTKKGDRVVSVRSESDPTKTELLTVEEAKERGIYNQDTTELVKKQQAILTSKETQDVFTEGGEEAYQEYVKSKLTEVESGDKQASKPGKEIELYTGTGDKPTSELGPEENKPGTEIELYRSPADRAKELLRDVDPASLEVMGRALNNYVKLAAQRERRAVTVNKYSEKEVEAARQEYELIRREVKQSVLNRLKATGLGPSEIEFISILDDGSEAKALKSAIAFEAKQLAGMGEQEGRLQQIRGNFLDWWSEQGGATELFSKAGLKGRAKKAGVMAALGFVPGVAAGVAGATVAGPFIGAAVAAGAATGVARGLMGAKLNRAAEGRTKIDAQAERRLTDQALAIDQADHSKGGAHEVSEAFRDGTEREVQRNRKRLVAAAGAGAIFGAIGAGTGQWLQERIDIPGGGSPETPSDAPTEVIPPETPDTPEVLGDSFTVEYGNGITHEILDYANAQGKTVSPERAYEIYEQLHNEFNRDIIDLAGTANDSYMHGSEVRISSPGQAQWFPEVEARLRELLEEADSSSS